MQNGKKKIGGFRKPLVPKISIRSIKDAPIPPKLKPEREGYVKRIIRELDSTLPGLPPLGYLELVNVSVTTANILRKHFEGTAYHVDVRSTEDRNVKTVYITVDAEGR